MVDSMIMVAPVDLLSIIHQAADRPIPSQMFGAGETATPEMQAQMRELHLQRRQLMATTAQQLALLQQRMRDLHMAALRDAAPLHGQPPWQPPQDQAAAAAADARDAHCAVPQLLPALDATQGHPARSPAAGSDSGVLAAEAWPALSGAAPSAEASAAAGLNGALRPPVQLHRPDAADDTSASGSLVQHHPASKAFFDGQQQGAQHVPATQPPQSRPRAPDVQRLGAADEADAAHQLLSQQQPVLQVQRCSSAADGGWVPAHSRLRGPRQRQQPRPDMAAGTPVATAAGAISVAAAHTSAKPNRYAMLPDASSPDDPSPADEAAPSAAALTSKAAAESAASAQLDSASLSDAAVQPPQLLLLPSSEPTDHFSKPSGDAVSAVQGAASDRSPPHPSTPRQPADGAPADGDKPDERSSATSCDAAISPPADACSRVTDTVGAAPATGAAVSARDSTVSTTVDVALAACGASSRYLGADDDSSSRSVTTASLASASDDGNETRAERQRQRQKAKQGRQRAARRTEAQRRQEEEALLAAAAQERAEGLAEQERRQRECGEARAREHTSLQEARRSQPLAADGLGQQMPLFAVRSSSGGSMGSGALGGGRSGGSAGTFRFNFPVPVQPAK